MTEPATTLTDFLLALIAARLFMGMAPATGKAQSLARVFFLALALASLTAGLEHGFGTGLGPGVTAFVWTTSLVSLAIAGGALFLAAGEAYLGPSSARRWRGPVLLLVLVDLWWALPEGAFRAVLVLDLVALLTLLACATFGSSRQSPSTRLLVSGGLLSLLAAVVQAFELGFSPGFDHNALFHLIEALALVPLARGFALWHQEGSSGSARVAALARAKELLVLGGKGRLPLAAALIQAGLIALASLILGANSSPTLFLTLLLCLSGLLVAAALLGDLAPLLAEDPAAEWILSQPLLPHEPESARLQVLLRVLGLLAMVGLLPAALMSGDLLSPAARLLLPVAGAWQALAVAALLLLAQRLFGRRARALSILLQTIVLCALFAGTSLALAALPSLERWFEGQGFFLPPAVLARLLQEGFSHSPALLALLLLPLPLLLLPPAKSGPAPRARNILGTLLRPIARLTERFILRGETRAAFRFLWAAIPAERDFAVRVWPLVLAPVALLAVGADPSTREGQGLFALAAFSPAAFLPIVLQALPATATPAARWLLDCSPLPPRAEEHAARWVVLLLVVLPLQAVIGGLLALVLPLEMVLAFCFGSLAVAGLSLLLHWKSFVPGPPLSRPAGELVGAFEGGASPLLTQALRAGALALLTFFQAPPWPALLLFFLLVLLVAAILARRATPGPAAH